MTSTLECQENKIMENFKIKKLIMMAGLSNNKDNK